MREHVKVLGILHVALGSLGALAGIAALLLMGGLGAIVAMAGHEEPEALVALPILWLIGLVVAGLALLLAVPQIVAGYGLLKLRPWSRILSIIISALSLINVPLGTLLGAYGLWVMLQPETEALLAGGPVRRAA